MIALWLFFLLPAILAETFSTVEPERFTTIADKCNGVEDCGEEDTKLSYILPLPFITELNGTITPGQIFVFKGKTYPSSQEWSINFHCKGAIWNNGSDAPLHISFHNDTIRFSTFKNNAFIYDESHSMPDSLKSKNFDIRLVAHEDNFQMFINHDQFATYTLRLQLSSITRISVMAHKAHPPSEGLSDVTLHYVKLGKKYEPVPKESGITTTGFSFCKTLFISGVIDLHVKRVSINFIRNNESESWPLQNAFQLNALFDTKSLFMEEVANGQSNGTQNAPLPFAKDVPFNLSITNGNRGFVIHVNGKHHTTFIHRVCPRDITTIWITGISDLTATVSHAEKCDLDKKPQTICRVEEEKYENPRLTYVLPLPFYSALKDKIEPGQTLIFKGRTYSGTGNGTGKWYIAFECNTGSDTRIEMSVNHYYGYVTFMTLRNKEENNREEHPLPDSLKNKDFDLRIRAYEDRLEFIINNKNFATYMLREPLSSITHVQAASHGGNTTECTSDKCFSFLDYDHRDGGFPEVTFHYIHLGEKYEPVPKESGITTTGFSYCKTMHITGVIEPHVTRFQVNFIRKNETEYTHRQNALQFNPRFEEDKISINDAINGLWGESQYATLRFTRGVPFSLTITNDYRGFVIVADGREIAIFAHRICPLDITTIWIGQIADLTVEVSHAANCEVPAEKTGICAKSP